METDDNSIDEDGYGVDKSRYQVPRQDIPRLRAKHEPGEDLIK